MVQEMSFKDCSILALVTILFRVMEPFQQFW